MNDKIKRGLTAAALAPAAVFGIAACGNSPPEDTPVVTHSNDITTTNVPYSPIANDMRTEFQRCEAAGAPKLLELQPGMTVTVENREVPTDVARTIINQHNNEQTHAQNAATADCKAKAMVAVTKKYEKVDGNGDVEEDQVQKSKWVVETAQKATETTANREKTAAAEAGAAKLAAARGDLSAHDASVREDLATVRVYNRVSKEASQVERDAKATQDALNTAQCDYDRATGYTTFQLYCSYVPYQQDAAAQNEAEWIAFDRSAGKAFAKAEDLAADVNDANQLFKDEGVTSRLSTSVDNVARNYWGANFWATISGDQEYRDWVSGSQITALSGAVEATRTEAGTVARTNEAQAQQLTQQVDTKAQQEVNAVISKAS